MKTTSMLRQMIAKPGVTQAAGVGDAGQARLVEAVGFPVVYMSGSYVNHTRGVPDGTLTLNEIATRVGEISDRITVPLIADGDEGFGGVLKIVRTIHDFERAGAAALHMEDMSVKKHGHPIPIPEMVRNIKVAMDARSDPDFVIIGRTDAMANWREGVKQNRPACEEEAFERAVAYAEAGADVIMPMHFTLDWIRRYGNKISKPLLLINPQMTLKEIEPYNVKIVIHPADMLSRSVAFMKQEYSKWLADGMLEVTDAHWKQREDANDLIGVPEKYATLAKYGE
ncbi:MAG: 2-methylisocitrate lyase [Nitrosomonadaceae bacterium]|nr:2-methylisocitrate lyase [Nitrosomonadaceae bacterium]